MIDQKINNSLKELEQSLKDIESAKEQVESVINSYDSLADSTSDYVKSIESLTFKVKELVDVIGKDYNNKVASFENERKSIIKSINATTQRLSDTTDLFNTSLTRVEFKQKLSLFFNLITILLIAILYYIAK